MSLQTTSKLIGAPAAGASITVADGGNGWVWGSWVTMLAATTTATAAIAGIALGEGTYSTMQTEIQIGVGGAGSEVDISLVRLYGPNSGSGSHSVFLLPIPITGIALGSRIAFRRRASLTGSVTCALLYFDGLDSDAVTTKKLTAAPLGANAVSVTPNAGAWVNSTWNVLFAGVAHEIAIVGLAMSNPVPNIDIEYDLATGAPAAETVVTTIRSACMQENAGKLWFAMLPEVLPLEASSIVSVRLRKTGTSTTAHTVALLYYDDTTFLTTPVPTPGTARDIRRVRVFSHISDVQEWLFWKSLQIDMETGTAQTLTSDPTVWLRYSDDGGHTWSHLRSITAGRRGQYAARVLFRQLGRSRDRVYELSVSDPCPWTFLRAIADVEKGIS